MTQSIRRLVTWATLIAALLPAVAPQAAAAGMEPTHFDMPKGGHPHDVAAAPGAGGAWGAESGNSRLVMVPAR